VSAVPIIIKMIKVVANRGLFTRPIRPVTVAQEREQLNASGPRVRVELDEVDLPARLGRPGAAQDSDLLRGQPAMARPRRW
jgi:hypothetical protein